LVLLKGILLKIKLNIPIFHSSIIPCVSKKIPCFEFFVEFPRHFNPYKLYALTQKTHPPNWPVIFSWSLYDFANTIFSMNIISLYFPLWVTVDKGGEDILYGFALSFSMLLVAISMPLFGAYSDRVGRRMPLLIGLTILFCFFYRF